MDNAEINKLLKSIESNRKEVIQIADNISIDRGILKLNDRNFVVDNIAYVFTVPASKYGYKKAILRVLLGIVVVILSIWLFYIRIILGVIAIMVGIGIAGYYIWILYNLIQINSTRKYSTGVVTNSGSVYTIVHDWDIFEDKLVEGLKIANIDKGCKINMVNNGIINNGGNVTTVGGDLINSHIDNTNTIYGTVNNYDDLLRLFKSNPEMDDMDKLVNFLGVRRKDFDENSKEALNINLLIKDASDKNKSSLKKFIQFLGNAALKVLFIDGLPKEIASLMGGIITRIVRG